MSFADVEDGGGVVEESDACNDRRARIAAIRAKRCAAAAGTAAPPSDGTGAGSGASARVLRMRGAQRAEPEEQDFGASVGNAMAEASAVSSTTGCLDRKAQMEALRAKRAARSQQQEDGGGFGVGGEARAAPGALSARSACHLDLQVDSARTQRLGQRADGRRRDAGHTAGEERSPASPVAPAGAAPMQQRQARRPIVAAASLSLKKSDDQPWQPGAQIASESYSARQEVKKKKTPPELSSLYVADLDDVKKRSPLQPLDAHAVLARSAAEEARGSGTAAGNSERRIRLDTIRASRASRGQWGVKEADVLESRAPVPGRPPAGAPGEASEGPADVGRSARRQRIEAMRARGAGRSFGEGLDEHEGEAREGAMCQQRSAAPGACTSAQDEQDWRGLEQPLSLSRVESIQVAQRERHANQPSLPSSRVDRIRELQRARGAAQLAAGCLADGGRDDHTQAEGLGPSKQEEAPVSSHSRDVGDFARALAAPPEEGAAERRGVSRQGSRAEDIAVPGGAMNGEGLEGSWDAAEAGEEEEEVGRPQDEEEVPPRVGAAPASPAAAASPVSVSPRQQPAAAEEYADEDDGAEANVDGGDGQIVAVVATPESIQELQVVNPHLEELRLKWQKYTQGLEVVEERSCDEAQECIYHDLLTKWDTAKGGPDAGLSATSALRPLLEPIDVRVCLSGPAAPEEEEPYKVAKALNLEFQDASWDGPRVAPTTQAPLAPPPLPPSWLDAPWATSAVPLLPPAHVRSIDGGARRPLPKVPGGVPLGGASKPSGLRSQQVDECVHQ